MELGEVWRKKLTCRIGLELHPAAPHSLADFAFRVDPHLVRCVYFQVRDLETLRRLACASNTARPILQTVLHTVRRDGALVGSGWWVGQLYGHLFRLDGVGWNFHSRSRTNSYRTATGREYSILGCFPIAPGTVLPITWIQLSDIWREMLAWSNANN